MFTRNYSEWLKATSSEINTKLGEFVLTDDELCQAIPQRVYTELSESGDLDKRTLVIKIPVGVFERLYQKHAGFRKALKGIHARL